MFRSLCLFVFTCFVFRIQCSSSWPDQEILKKNVVDLIDQDIDIKSRLSFTISHRPVKNTNNIVFVYWMKTIRKGIYLETKHVSGQYKSTSEFFKLSRIGDLGWKLRNITDSISKGKIELIKTNENTGSEPGQAGNDLYELKFLPKRKFRLVKSDSKNRYEIQIFDVRFQGNFPVNDFLYVGLSEQNLVFCTLHDGMTNASVAVVYEEQRKPTQASGRIALRDVLCIDPNLNFPDTWVSSSLKEPIMDIHISKSSRGLLFASRFMEPITLNEARMLHVDQFETMVSFDFGKSWTTLKLDNKCVTNDRKPRLFLDQAFSRLFYDKTHLGIIESPETPGFLISTGHLLYSKESTIYPGVFVSENGGLTWRMVFDERFLLAMSPSGEVVYAIRHCLSGVTRKMYASYDFGRTWMTYDIFNMDMCVHEISKSKFDVFILLSTEPDSHHWVFTIIDFEDSRKSLHKCNREDIHLWPPGTTNLYCVRGQQILRYRRNPDGLCSLGKFGTRNRRYRCPCTIHDLICEQDRCENLSDIKFINGSDIASVNNVLSTSGLRVMEDNRCKVKNNEIKANYKQPKSKSCRPKSDKFEKYRVFNSSSNLSFSSLTLSLIYFLALLNYIKHF